MAHPWHDIPIPSDEELTRQFPAVIEISKGSKNKYEIDKHTGLLKLDRVLFSAVHYPANYGFIPRTLGEDGDAVDVLVLGQEPVLPMSFLMARCIGGFSMKDEAGIDDKIIAVHVNDPAFRSYTSVEELPEHITQEMMAFFESYKQLENKMSEVGRKLTRDEANAVIIAGADAYRDYMYQGHS